MWENIGKQKNIEIKSSPKIFRIHFFINWIKFCTKLLKLKAVTERGGNSGIGSNLLGDQIQFFSQNHKETFFKCIEHQCFDNPHLSSFLLQFSLFMHIKCWWEMFDWNWIIMFFFRLIIWSAFYLKLLFSQYICWNLWFWPNFRKLPTFVPLCSVGINRTTSSIELIAATRAKSWSFRVCYNRIELINAFEYKSSGGG